MLQPTVDQQVLIKRSRDFFYHPQVVINTGLEDQLIQTGQDGIWHAHFLPLSGGSFTVILISCSATTRSCSMVLPRRCSTVFTF